MRRKMGKAVKGMKNDALAPLRGRGRGLANVLGLFAAFGIAFGGLLLVQKLLIREEEALMRSGGMVEVAVQEPETGWECESARETEKAFLTAEELVGIVSMLGEGADAYLHEPFPGQLSMTEAMECGREWLEDFLAPRLGAEEYIPQEYKISCYLMAFREGDGALADKDTLSYWMMTYEARDMKAELMLNAVTGQVLDASAYCYFPMEFKEDGGLRELLGDYADSFGLEGRYAVVGTDDWDGEGGMLMFRDIGDTGVYAVAKASSTVLSLSETNPGYIREVYHLRLYLDDSLF